MLAFANYEDMNLIIVSCKFIIPHIILPVNTFIINILLTKVSFSCIIKIKIDERDESGAEVKISLEHY
jgi:hypothetical protein